MYFHGRASAVSRARASSSRSARVKFSAKSSGSWTSRSSISASSNGARFSHSIASCLELHFHSQKPPTSSFDSGNGPSVTMGFLPANVTRAPVDIGASPSNASNTPALANSSLYLPIAAMMIIHDTPKPAATIPKRGEKKVLASPPRRPSPMSLHWLVVGPSPKSTIRVDLFCRVGLSAQTLKGLHEWKAHISCEARFLPDPGFLILVLGPAR